MKFDPRDVRVFFGETELLPLEEPPAPDNPDFEELHTEAQANEIERRFEAGFALRELNDYQQKQALLRAQDDAIRRQELKRLERLHHPLTATIKRAVHAKKDSRGTL